MQGTVSKCSRKTMNVDWRQCTIMSVQSVRMFPQKEGIVNDNIL